MRASFFRLPTALTNSATGTAWLVFVALSAAACGKSGDGGTQPIVTPPGFAVSLSSSSLNVNAGGTASLIATIARTGSFAGTVNVAAEGLPAGVTAAFSPAAITSSVTSTTFSVTAASTTVPGTYTFTIRGTASGITDQTASASITVLAQPAFALSLSSQSLTVQAGSTGRTIAQIARTNFSEAIVMSVEGAPTGVTTQVVTPSLANDTTSLALTVANTVAPGTYALVVRARSSLADRTSPLTLIVTPPPDFTLTSSAATLSVQQGQSTAPATLTIARSGGFTGAVDLTTTGLPSGVTATFANSSVAGASTTLTLTATSTATVGNTNVVVHANAPGLIERTVTIALTVTLAPGGFTLTLTPATLSVPQAASATITVSIVRTAPFSGAVALSLTGAGTGVTATLNSTTIAAGATSATITVAAAILAPTVLSSFAVHATASGVTNQDAPLAVTVAASQASMVSQHVLVQQGLGMALSFSVLQAQLQVIGQSVVHGVGSARACSTMPGSGSVQSLPIGVDNSTRTGFYWDQACTKPYILSDITSFAEDVNHQVDVAATAQYFSLTGAPLGTLRMLETAQVTASTNQFISGLGTFTPATGAPPVNMGISCAVQTAGQTIVPCSGGVVQNFASLGIAVGSVTPLTLHLTALDAPMTFDGNSAVLMTGANNTLTLTAPTHSTLAISGGTVWGTSSQQGGTGTFSLFPALPAGWSITDSQHDMRFAIDFVNDGTGNSTGTVKQISTGSVLATVVVNGSGTGTATWSDGSAAAITGWALAN
ncbi:MAG: hypothetical protein ABJB66_11800 [Gemmatimonadaceae bacterium]